MPPGREVHFNKKVEENETVHVYNLCPSNYKANYDGNIEEASLVSSTYRIPEVTPELKTMRSDNLEFSFFLS